MAEDTVKAGRPWLEERMASLDAVYHRFGREGLKDYSINDVGMLLSFKELEFRDMPKGNQTDQQRAAARQLELEIKDLTGFVNGTLAAANLSGPRRQFSQYQQQQHKRPQKSRDFDMER